MGNLRKARPFNLVALPSSILDFAPVSGVRRRETRFLETHFRGSYFHGTFAGCAASLPLSVVLSLLLLCLERYYRVDCKGIREGRGQTPKS